MRRASWIAVATLVASVPCAAQNAVVVKCKADFSLVGRNELAVEIARAASGKMIGRVDGKVSNPDVKSSVYAIRPNMKMDVSVAEADAAKFNPGELSVQHLFLLVNDKEIGRELKIPFDLKTVASVREYDLLGKTDEYGGMVLLEAFDTSGKLLGRVMRALAANGCF